jgi:delta24-sterol reductase
VTEWVPLTDYLFRYDRGAFWVGRYSFSYFLVPFNRLTRLLLDPFMHTRTMYRALHKSGLADFYLIQDVSVPFAAVPEFAAWLDATFHIRPLWVCPLRFRRTTPNARHGLHAAFGAAAAPPTDRDRDTASPDSDSDGAAAQMNFGVWGPGSFDRREAVRLNRLLERKVRQLGGHKWLYAHAYYTEAEFWAGYDRASYDGLRARFAADWLPSVYDKVRVDVPAEERARATWTGWLLALFWSVWPLRGLYGVLMTVVGGDYLLKSSASSDVPGFDKDV